MSTFRYAIGIDLGTTNCTLAYVDLRSAPDRIETLPIPQLQSLRTVIESPLLPSFFYYPTAAEIDQGELDPFSAEAADEPAGFVIGAFAREQMTALPGRVIHSAKSWLAHAGVDREAQMLPFGSEEIPTELRLSPVEASSAYLGYLKEAWDHAFARDDAGNAFADQRIVITVPASFDEGAQQLTRMAAEMAGYPPASRLLEEPQAAFYAWLDEQSRSAAHAPGAPLLQCLPGIAEHPQTVLVCDVGGGTTDFSLFRIAVVRSAADRPTIERIAASDHLLLGGDNIDLALAHAIERLLKPGTDDRLSRSQWSHLVPQARLLKERVLDTDADTREVFHVSIPGDGASLFAAALDATVTRVAVQDIVLEGFFPFCPRDELPRTRKSGLREIGLPYAVDTAISRHLAAFLRGRPVAAVLFAGGTLRPRVLQERLLAVMESWQGRRPVHLALGDMSLAIAEGAARFAALPEGSQERIRGGYPHSVYLELQRTGTDAVTQLVCVLPKGFEEGGSLKLAAPTFDLLVNRPVRFTAYTSNRRPEDAPGTLVTLDPGAFHPLPTLQTTIVLDDERFNPRTASEHAIRVQLEARLTELGGLRLDLVSADTGRSWELAFNLRKPVTTDLATEPVKAESPGVKVEAIQAAEARCALFFGDQAVARSGTQSESVGARSGTHSRAGAQPLEYHAPARTLAGDPSGHHPSRSFARARERLALSGRLRVAPRLRRRSRSLARHAALGVLRPGTRAQEGKERPVELVDDVAPRPRAGFPPTSRNGCSPPRCRTFGVPRRSSSKGRVFSAVSSASRPRTRWSSLHGSSTSSDAARPRISRTFSGHWPGCSAGCRSTPPPKRSSPLRW